MEKFSEVKGWHRKAWWVVAWPYRSDKEARERRMEERGEREKERGEREKERGEKEEEMKQRLDIDFFPGSLWEYNEFRGCEHKIVDTGLRDKQVGLHFEYCGEPCGWDSNYEWAEFFKQNNVCGLVRFGVGDWNDRRGLPVRRKK